jgi:parallel beta-helix repeat protein
MKNKRNSKNAKRIRTIVLTLVVVSSGFIGLISFESGIVSAESKILCVGGSGAGNYTNIQDAINAAEDGDTVFVYNGSYENIIINKSIILIGENKENTYFGIYGGTPITVTAWNVIIHDFLISGQGPSSNGGKGIFLEGVQQCRIYNNIIIDYNGIVLKSSSNNLIHNNDLISNSDGIVIESSNNNNISFNNISNTRYSGISLKASSNNNISNNDLSSNNHGIILESLSNYNTIYKNNISASTNDGIFIKNADHNHIHFNNISSNHENGILMNSSSGSIIIGNNITSNERNGIRIESSTNINISSNLLFNNSKNDIILTYSLDIETGNNIFDNGIYIDGDLLNHFNTHTIPDNNKINGNPILYYKNSKNIIIDKQKIGQLIISNCINAKLLNLSIHNINNGIEIYYSSKILVERCNLTNNDVGIGTFSTSHSIFVNNYVTNNIDGIHLKKSSFNQIKNNNVISNEHEGIDLERESNNNVIIDNYVSNNRHGIDIDNSLNNEIFNNYLINNGIEINGVSPSHYNSHSIASNNTVNGKQVYYLKNEKDQIIDKIQVAQIMIASCTNITVKNLQINNTVNKQNISNNYIEGIKLYFSSSINISNNIIIGNRYGIILYSSSNNSIINNELSSNNRRGILLSESSNYNIITKNILLSNNQSGIKIFKSSNHNLIKNNTIMYNGIGITVMSAENIILNNKISGNDEGIHFENEDFIRLVTYRNNISNNDITFNKDVGIILYASEENMFYNNNISSNGDSGIILWHYEAKSPDNNLFLNNTLMYNYKYGIKIERGKENKIIGNDIIYNKINGIYIYTEAINTHIESNNITMNEEDGIFLDEFSYAFIDNNTISYNKGNGIAFEIGNYQYKTAKYNYITQNRIFSNTLRGIYLAKSENNVVEYNSIFSNDAGLILEYSNNNRIEFNTIYSNKMEGISLDFADNNIILENEISKNELYGISISSSSNNKIYHNNFINNTNQFYYNDFIDLSSVITHDIEISSGLYFSYTVENFWNEPYPIGGNYWSDYNGSDNKRGPNQNLSGFDGIGDTPYVSLSEALDFYPLMEPYIYKQSKDYDRDWILDDWEKDYGLNPEDFSDAYEDYDNDNLTNIEEFLNQTNPKVSDSDNDDLLDGEEIKKYLTDPTNPDTDGDGWNDGTEVDRDTDPLDEDDYPRDAKANEPDFSLFILIPLLVVISIIFLAIHLKRLKERRRDSDE